MTKSPTLACTANLWFSEFMMAPIFCPELCTPMSSPSLTPACARATRTSPSAQAAAASSTAGRREEARLSLPSSLGSSALLCSGEQVMLVPSPSGFPSPSFPSPSFVRFLSPSFVPPLPQTFVAATLRPGRPLPSFVRRAKCRCHELLNTKSGALDVQDDSDETKNGEIWIYWHRHHGDSRVYGA